MDLTWPLVLAGVLVGLAVGMTGMGGGALLTPTMVLLFGVNPTAAVGSDLAVSVAMKPVGAVVHHRAGTVRWDIVRWLLPTAVPAGFLGAWLVSLLGSGAELQDRLKLAIGAALLLAVVGMAVRPMLARRREAESPASPVVARPVPTLLIGLAGGLIVGITSVGSGSLIVVMLMLTHPRLRPSELVGTDLVQAIPLVLSAALGHLIFGDTRLALAGTVLLGAIPGIYAGAKLATRVPDGALRWVLAILLVGSGLSLWDAPGLLIVVVSVALAAIACWHTYARRSGSRHRETRDAEAGVEVS
ncbi:MAG: TSUP family transporter [Streptosporangiales bacterium]|nr:TSUP family transporter [Streptosporangiales bacterium]